MTIQITRSGTVYSSSAKTLERMRAAFEQKHCLVLPQFLEKELLELIQSRIDPSQFYKERYKVGEEDAIGYRLRDESIVGLLHFLVNDEALFELIQKITGSRRISCFTGRVYSKIPNHGQYDSWHDDLTDTRMIALSINLSTSAYSGGILQIRNTCSKQLIHEEANTRFGDAIIFRIAPSLEHRVTRVDGSTTRTAFTGWFRSRPAYKPIFSPLFKKGNRLLKVRLSKRSFSITMGSRIRAAADLFFRYAGEQLLIYNPKGSICYGLDPIGARILEMLRESKTVGDVRDMILNEYEVESDQCDRDIITLIRRAADKGLIAVGEDDSVPDPSKLVLTEQIG